MDNQFKESCELLLKDDKMMARLGEGLLNSLIAIDEAGVNADVEKNEAVNGYIAVWERQEASIRELKEQLEEAVKKENMALADVKNMKLAFVNWIDNFVEYKADSCNGYQSAARFRDVVEEFFETHCGIKPTKSLWDAHTPKDMDYDGSGTTPS